MKSILLLSFVVKAVVLRKEEPSAEGSGSGSGSSANVTPALSSVMCHDLSVEIGATKCSLVKEISGSNDGCECQFVEEAKDCPGISEETGEAAKKLLYMGEGLYEKAGKVSHDNTASGFGITLCMYWAESAFKNTQGDGAKPVELAPIPESKENVIQGAQKLLDTAALYARRDSWVVATGWLRSGNAGAQ